MANHFLLPYGDQITVPGELLCVLTPWFSVIIPLTTQDIITVVIPLLTSQQIDVHETSSKLSRVT